MRKPVRLFTVPNPVSNPNPIQIRKDSSSAPAICLQPLMQVLLFFSSTRDYSVHNLVEEDRGNRGLGGRTSVAGVLDAHVVAADGLADLLDESGERVVEAGGGAIVLPLGDESGRRSDKVARLGEQPEGVVVEGVVWWGLGTGVGSESGGAVVLELASGGVVGDVGLPPVETGGAVGTETWDGGGGLSGGVASHIVWDGQVDEEEHVLVSVETRGGDDWGEGVWNGLGKLLGWDED